MFDAFGFLSDCLKHGVEEACDLKARGGFSKIISAGSQEPIRFELYYRETTGERPITYELEIDIDSSLRPYVKSERLRQRKKRTVKGPAVSFLNLSNGKGEAWGDQFGGRRIRKGIH